MRYVILDEMGNDIGGSIEQMWNKCQSECSNRKPYYAGPLRVFLMFLESEIKDDVQRNAVTQGRVAQKVARDTNKSVAPFVAFQEVGEMDNWEWSRRVISMAINEIESVLYLISKHRITNHRSRDNQKERASNTDGTAEWGAEFFVPDTFSDTSVDKLLHVSHDYIVCRILWEWANMTYPDFADFWEKKMKADLEELKIESRRAGIADNGRIKPCWP